MFYYPHLLKNKNLVNLEIVFPGGWGQLEKEATGVHFLWENLLFAPTKTLPDPDEWLWENTLDFWSVTSFESVRLNFTLQPSQVKNFVPQLKSLITPRPIKLDFLQTEIQELKNFWYTNRDRKEDALLRKLFKTKSVVHPNENLVDNLSASDLDKVLTLWAKVKPFIIILGKLSTEDLITLGQIFPEKTHFKTVKSYLKPLTAQNFFSPTRWGIKINLQQSHIYELLVIELWEQLFKIKFYFEYHLKTLFIWTEDIEHPALIVQKVKAYTLQEADFNKTRSTYLKFLTAIYQGETSVHLEKLAELIEGLHAHRFQIGSYGVDASHLDLSKTFQDVNFSDFKNFYKSFIAVLPAQPKNTP